MMMVNALVRILVMGVSGNADDRGRNMRLEQWWGEYNYQLGLAGSDEASGNNLPCNTCTRAQECLLSASVTPLSSL